MSHHIYGTAALERYAATENQASLVFTADENVRHALVRNNAEKDFTNRNEAPPSAPNPQAPAPETRPRVVTEQEEAMAEIEEEDDAGEEDIEHPQARAAETQLGLVKRQEEFYLLLKQQAITSFSKEDFKAHVKSLPESKLSSPMLL